MSLEDALLALTPRPKPQGCKTCAWLQTQSAKVQDFVEQWIIEQHSRIQLWKVLSDHGYPLSDSALKNHYDHVTRAHADDA